MNTPSTTVSPGIGGFLAFFVLAVALWLLMRNMNARMRRMSYRAEDAQRKAQEAAASGRPQGPVGGAAEAGTPEDQPRADAAADAAADRVANPPADPAAGSSPSGPGPEAGGAGPAEPRR